MAPEIEFTDKPGNRPGIDYGATITGSFLSRNWEIPNTRWRGSVVYYPRLYDTDSKVVLYWDTEDLPSKPEYPYTWKDVNDIIATRYCGSPDSEFTKDGHDFEIAFHKGMRIIKED